MIVNNSHLIAFKKANEFEFVEVMDNSGFHPGRPGTNWRMGDQRQPQFSNFPEERRSRERHVPVDFRDFSGDFSASHNRSPPRSRSPGMSMTITFFLQFSVLCSNVRST